MEKRAIKACYDEDGLWLGSDVRYVGPLAPAVEPDGDIEFFAITEGAIIAGSDDVKGCGAKRQRSAGRGQNGQERIGR